MTISATPAMTRTARPVFDAMNLENPMISTPSLRCCCASLFTPTW